MDPTLNNHLRKMMIDFSIPTSEYKTMKDYKFPPFPERTQKLLNWINDKQIDSLDITEDELLEKKLKENDIKKAINKTKELDTLHGESFDKNTFVYNILFGLINDPEDNSEVEKNHGQLVKLNFHKIKTGNKETIRANMTRFGDIITDLYIVVPDDQNLNAILTATMNIEIGGTLILESTILFINFLASSLGKKIKKENNEIFIPIPICKLFMNAKLDILSLSYMECILNIKYESNKNVNISAIHAKYVFIDSDKRCRIISEGTTMVTFMNYIIKPFPDSNIMKFAIDRVLCPIFIIIWYIVDDSHFAEYQTLQPNLLNVTIDVHVGEFTFNKTIDSVKIKKIKNGKYKAYVIPINNMTYDELIDFIKESQRDTNKYINKLWQNSAFNIDVNLMWDGIQNGELIVEIIDLNIGEMRSGMFGFKYIS
jgi:hypothetical protein